MPSPASACGGWCGATSDRRASRARVSGPRKVDTTSVCVIPPCGSPPVANGLSIVRFPPGRVDRTAAVTLGYRGTMRVGESFTLYLVNSFGPVAAPADTIRTGVTWALGDSVAARVAGDGQGGARVTGVAPGVADKVFASGTQYLIWSCFGPYGGCDRITEVLVQP